MAKKSTVAVLQITSRPKNFRRAGFAFSHDTTTLRVDQLEKNQIAALKAEPNLVVIEAQVEIAEEAEAA